MALELLMALAVIASCEDRVRVAASLIRRRPCEGSMNDDVDDDDDDTISMHTTPMLMAATIRTVVATMLDPIMFNYVSDIVL